MNSFFTQLALSHQNGHRLGRHLLFWAACWLFQSFLYGFIYNPEGFVITSFKVSAVEALLYLPQHIFLSYGILYWVLSCHVFHERYWVGLLVLMVLVMITAALSPLIQFVLIDTYRTWMNLYNPQKGIFFSFLGGLRGSMTIAGFAAAIKILKHWHFKKLENEQLEKQKLIAELELLKGQLHPHFMFNTLNSIYAQALKSSKETAQSILHLSHMMRYLMTDSAQPYITLNDELKTIETYVAMEKNRLGNRLDLSISIRGELHNSIIAPLILLPFVENSFKHGVNQMTECAWMSLDVQVQDHQMTFKLINGKNEQSALSSSGIGLKNVRKRLALLYPKLHQLQIHEDEQTYVVSLYVQLNKNSFAA